MNALLIAESRAAARALAGRVLAVAPEAAGLRVVSGFDAFVDEIGHVVGTRHTPTMYDRLPTIADYAAWAAASAGRSGLREYVVLERAAGGCTVNMGDGIATLGFPLDVFATLGDPPDPAFEALAGKCRGLHPLGLGPGRTLVTEFEDGKLMHCSFSHFAGVTPDFLGQRLLEGGYVAACEAAAGIVLTSWSVFPHMTECWRALQATVLGGLRHRPRFFFDLADPASRRREDLVAMAGALPGFEPIGPVILSLNGNEATQLAQALGLEPANLDGDGIVELAVALRARIGISEVGVHVVKGAASATADGADVVAGPFCPKPAKSVGAGDRFNAGWLAARLLGLDRRESLLMATAVSGFFVRAARSGTLAEVADFLEHWTSDSP